MASFVTSRTTVWRLLFVFCTIKTIVLADKVWSPWYNSSPGMVQAVEDETLHRISLTFSLPCGVSDVVDVQCRQSGSNETFREERHYNSNVLHVPCNITGLLCRNEDQRTTGTALCADYEVRVLCRLRGQDTSETRPSGTIHPNVQIQDLGANGGFIAMAAGGSVVLPLLCVLIMQLRKSKREERRRRQQAQTAAENMARAQQEATVADAPPAYEELFGGSPAPVSLISDGTLAHDAMMSEVDEQRRGSRERLVNDPRGRGAVRGRAGEGRINHGASLDLSSQQPSSSSSVSVTSQSTFITSSVTPSPPVPTVHFSDSLTDSSASSSSLSFSADVRRTSSASAGAVSTTSTDALLPATSSDNDVTHNDPPPAYDWPGHGASRQVTVILPPGDADTSERGVPCSPPSGSVVTAQPSSSGVVGTPRRFVGMHLSIFDLMAVIYPDPTATPPPSYDDALKILGAGHTQSQVQVT